jgi:L-idonate 5-dehydrogenase
VQSEVGRPNIAPYAASKGAADRAHAVAPLGRRRRLDRRGGVPGQRRIELRVGLGGETNIPINTIVAKEFDLRGTFRFHEKFETAVRLLNDGRVDLKPLISATLPYRDAARAFALAADRSQAMKVLLSFE